MGVDLMDESEVKNLAQIDADDNEFPSNSAEPEIVVTDPTPKKRGRGRPRKDGSADAAPSAVKIDPANKPTIKRTAKKSATDSKAMAQTLLALHGMLAQLPRFEVFAITEDESVLLAEAMARVGEEYDLSVSPKAAATMQLIGALGMVYGTRAMYVIKQNAEAKKRVPGLSVVSGDSGNSQSANSDG